MSNSTELLWVDDLDDSCISKAGAKIARLGELRRTGVRVPDGFVVTTDAFERFFKESGVASKVERMVARLDPNDDVEVAAASRRIRMVIEDAPMCPVLGEQIVDAYEELSYRRRDLNIPVAVRSSATGEDACDASFAGQFDTLLGVTGGPRILSSVKRCWSSLFSERALGYWMRKGLDYRNNPMAVGVLELIQARSSGVAFSIHPVSGNRHRMVIEGSWGWGESVVQGTVTPDKIEIGKSDGRILDYRISDKKVVSAFDYEAGLITEREMPRRLRNEPILNEEQIKTLVSTVLGIEEKYGYPVDVEWVMDRDRRPGEPVVIVQTRPITVKAPPVMPTWDPVAYASKYAFRGLGLG
jgi:pyruvate, water dikinase